jgi:hypothetical protein
MRLDMTVQGSVGTQAFDGTTGWVLMPFAGVSEPDIMPPEVVAEARAQADFDGPLVDYAAKGHRVELVGSEPVDGKDAFKLKVTLKSGGIRHIYLDAQTYLEVKSEGTRQIGAGVTVESDARASDYRKVDGLMVPFALETGVRDSPQRQKMTVAKVELNVPIDDGRFRPPAKKSGAGQ